MQRGWRAVGDWWDPACEAVAEAVLASADPAPAIFRLGGVRAQLGCDIEETIEDLAALWSVHSGGEPPLRLVREVAAGWADSSLELAGADSCLDPLTGLFSRAYLEARLAELYRQARGALVGEAHVLIVVDIGGIKPIDRLAVMRPIAEALRRVFTSGETLSILTPGRAAVLAQPGPDLPARLTELDLLLCSRPLGVGRGAAIWVESLPRTFALVQALVRDLSY